MRSLLIACLLCAFLVGCDGCNRGGGEVSVSDAGVKRVHVKIQTDAEGTTIEQRNIRDRIMADNKPGAIKHLYVLSAYSGQVLIYSTVKGKATSSGKRLTPYSVVASRNEATSSQYDGMPITINGNMRRTSEVIQDDGTYGSSVEYLYWWDVGGRYHQHYISGGQIVHISDQPLPVKSITINMELTKGD